MIEHPDAAPTLLPRKRKRTQPLQFNWKKLHKDLEALRTAQGVSIRQLASELKVTPSIFTRLKNGHAVKTESMLTLFEWSGFSVRTYVK